MPDTQTSITFRDLIAPMTPETFFADHFGRRAVHIPGDADKIRRLFDWSSFNRLVNMTTVWNAHTMKMVTCNAYYSRCQRPAFKSHFDTMEVFAVHIEGEKTWHLYEGHFEQPIEADGYRYSSFDEAYHAKAKGARTQEITMTPGDILYIPRGQYHDALAASDSCLHLSFGTTRPTGLDFLRTVTRAATADPLFRREMPTVDEPELYRERVRDLAGRLLEILDDPKVTTGLLEEQRRRLFDMIPGFDLPDPEFAGFFRVQATGVKLARRGQDWQVKTPKARDTLTPATAELAQWVLDRDVVTRAELETGLPDLSEPEIRNGVSHLRTLGILLRA